MALLGVWQTTRQGRVLTRYALPFLAVEPGLCHPAAGFRLHTHSRIGNERR